MIRSRLIAALAASLAASGQSAPAAANPYLPANDNVVLAELPAGARHGDFAARGMASARLDVAVPLAQFYIEQSRLSGDLRNLGYAEAVLAPWLKRLPPPPEVLVLQATVQQSRHEFAAALATLDRALAARPGDAQALLTRSTILRVLGQYSEAEADCERFARASDSGIATLCAQSLRALRGHLRSAYDGVRQIGTEGWLNAERSWRYCELGEMAARLGLEPEAERWFAEDLRLAPHDAYGRAAYADLLLRQGRAGEALALLQGQDSSEPLLLRIAIAQRQLHDPQLTGSRARLQAAFTAEQQRGEAVHRREQARFLLEVEAQPRLALSAARDNWAQQREPDDLLVLVAAARAAGEPSAAAPALAFASREGLSDARLDALREAESVAAP